MSVALANGNLCFVVGSLRIPDIPNTTHTNCRQPRAHLLLTERTTVEEIFTVFSSYHDLHTLEHL